MHPQGSIDILVAAGGGVHLSFAFLPHSLQMCFLPPSIVCLPLRLFSNLLISGNSSFMFTASDLEGISSPCFELSLCSQVGHGLFSAVSHTYLSIYQTD